MFIKEGLVRQKSKKEQEGVRFFFIRHIKVCTPSFGALLGDERSRPYTSEEAKLVCAL
jgi:hypothetical protein